MKVIFKPIIMDLLNNSFAIYQMKERKNDLVTEADGWHSCTWDFIHLFPGFPAWPGANFNLPMPTFPPL